MINQEIVTYLKGEKDIKKGFALLDKEKKKDKPQYLPYLFIIFYCSKNKTIEGQAKRLIDSLIPEKIVKFQNSFVQKFRLLDNDMKEFQLEMEEDDLSVDDWEFTIDQKDEAKKEIAQISKLSGWADSYLKAFFLPVWLWWFFHPWKNGSHKGTSISKIQLLHAPLVSFYYSDLLEDVGNFDVIEGNKFFLKWILDICENLQKNNSMICDFEEEPYIEIQSSSNCLEFISKTKELKALHFLEKVTRHDKDFDNQDHLACSSETYSEYMEAAEKAVLEFESHLTYEIRLNNQMFEDPGLNEGVTGAIKASDVICITGKLNSFDTKAKAKEHLENLGYEVRSTVTKDVTILLNESGVESGKTKKARDNGVRIVTTIDELEVEHLPKGENKKSTKKDSSNLDPLTETETSLDKKKIALIKDIKSLDEYNLDSLNKLISEAPKELKVDREVIMSAVKKNGFALQYASKEVKADKKIVMAAVKQSGEALEFASLELQDDKKIVIEAVKRDPGFDIDGKVILRHASKRLQNDKEVAIVAAEANIEAFFFLNDSLRQDSAVILAVLKNSNQAESARAASFSKNSSILEDKNFLLEALKVNGLFLKYLDENYKNKLNFVLAAVKNNGMAIEYASDNYKEDKKVVIAAVKSFGRALQFASEELQNDREVVIASVKWPGRSLEYASIDLQNDKEIVTIAVKQDSRALQYASKKLQKDKDVIALLKKHD